MMFGGIEEPLADNIYQISETQRTIGNHGLRGSYQYCVRHLGPQHNDKITVESTRMIDVHDMS